MDGYRLSGSEDDVFVDLVEQVFAHVLLPHLPFGLLRDGFLLLGVLLFIIQNFLDPVKVFSGLLIQLLVDVPEVSAECTCRWL